MYQLVSTQTPLRIGLLGGGTDLEQVSNQIGGAVLSLAIKQYVYVTVKKHSGLFLDKYRLQYSETERCTELKNIKNNIIRNTLQYFNIDEPLVINTISDVPASTGLGSSSSFTVGLVNALNQMFNLGISKSSIPEISFLIEKSIKGNEVGRQDMYASATGGLNLFEFGEKSIISPIINTEKITEKVFEASRIFYTNIQRSASSILSKQKKEINLNISSYAEMKEIAIEGYKIFKNQDRGFKRKFVEILKKNTELKYKLHEKILPENILEVENCITKSGAIATKLLGAGGGGFVLGIFENKNDSVLSKKNVPLTSLPIEIDLIGTRVTQLI